MHRFVIPNNTSPSIDTYDKRENDSDHRSLIVQPRETIELSITFFRHASPFISHALGFAHDSVLHEHRDRSSEILHRKTPELFIVPRGSSYRKKGKREEGGVCSFSCRAQEP